MSKFTQFCTDLGSQLHVSRKHGIQVQEEDKFWKTTDEMARNCKRQHYRFMLTVAFGLLSMRTATSVLSEGPALLTENKIQNQISGHSLKLIINSLSFSSTKTLILRLFRNKSCKHEESKFSFLYLCYQK